MPDSESISDVTQPTGIYILTAKISVTVLPVVDILTYITLQLWNENAISCKNNLTFRRTFPSLFQRHNSGLSTKFHGYGSRKFSAVWPLINLSNFLLMKHQRTGGSTPEV